MLYRKAKVNTEGETNLRDLVLEARNGDTNAFRVIFDQFVDRLYGYSFSRTQTRADALDVVQETFVDLWSALPGFEFRSDEEFSGFIFKILKRKISKLHRARRADVSLDDLGSDIKVEVEIEDYRFIMDGLDSLSPKYREVVKLRYWSGMTFSEIASILNSNEGAIKVRHHRAIEKLKKKIEDEEHRGNIE